MIFFALGRSFIGFNRRLAFSRYFGPRESLSTVLTRNFGPFHQMGATHRFAAQRHELLKPFIENFRLILLERDVKLGERLQLGQICGFSCSGA